MLTTQTHRHPDGEYRGGGTRQTSVDLIEAQNTYAIIDVQLQGSDTTYQSTIVAVDPEARQIIIDEMFPGGFTAARGMPIVITLRLAGNRRVALESRLLERQTNGSNTRYCIAMPAHCTYSQRREAYRFRLPQQAGGYAEFLAPGHHFCSALVGDVSLTGMRLTLNHRISVRVGELLDSVLFHFAGEQFHCRVVVRNLQVDANGSDVVGVEFIDMPRPEQRMLEKILVQFHRNLARERARSRLRENATLH